MARQRRRIKNEAAVHVQAQARRRQAAARAAALRRQRAMAHLRSVHAVKVLQAAARRRRARHRPAAHAAAPAPEPIVVEEAPPESYRPLWAEEVAADEYLATAELAQLIYRSKPKKKKHNEDKRFRPRFSQMLR